MNHFKSAELHAGMVIIIVLIIAIIACYIVGY